MARLFSRHFDKQNGILPGCPSPDRRGQRLKTGCLLAMTTRFFLLAVVRFGVGIRVPQVVYGPASGTLYRQIKGDALPQQFVTVAASDFVFTLHFLHDPKGCPQGNAVLKSLVPRGQIHRRNTLRKGLYPSVGPWWAFAMPAGGGLLRPRLCRPPSCRKQPFSACKMRVLCEEVHGAIPGFLRFFVSKPAC